MVIGEDGAQTAGGDGDWGGGRDAVTADINTCTCILFCLEKYVYFSQ